mmetsp:Transcript_17962/g.29113  ORF Transcript_17962/g.29113 Transcript_17962/m.29113 type:complete len:83 (-) Transcript_17962:168-416(-)
MMAFNSGGAFNFCWSLFLKQLSAFAQWWGIFSPTTVFLCYTCPLWWSVVCWHRPDHSNTAVGLLRTNRTHSVSEQQLMTDDV